MTKSQTLAISSLRYIPICGVLISVINVSLIILGIDLPFMEIAVTVAGFYMIILFSRVFHFCIVHRLCVYYAFIIFVFTWIRRFTGGYGSLSPYTLHIRVVILSLGVAILSLVFRRYIKSKILK